MMTKLLVSLLLLLLHASSSSATHLLRRLMDSAMMKNGDDKETGSSEAMLALQNMDMSCMMGLAIDEPSCTALSDTKGEACVWCPIGSQDQQFGSCVSSDAASMMNAANIPHLHCLSGLTVDDEEFYTDLMGCASEGITGSKCIVTSGSCTWCVAKEPVFGACYSQAFVDEVKSFDDPENAETNWDSLFECSQDTSKEELMNVGALADTKCFAEGMPTDSDPFADVGTLCVATLDAAGKDCLVVNVMGIMDVCVTETQKTFWDYMMAQLNGIGIDNPMSLLGMLGGGDDSGSVFDGDDAFNFFGNEEEVAALSAFGDELYFDDGIVEELPEAQD